MNVASPFEKKSSKTARSPEKQTPTTVPTENQKIYQTRLKTRTESLDNEIKEQSTSKPTQITIPSAPPVPETPINIPKTITKVATMNHQQIQQNIASFVPEFNGKDSPHRENELSRFIDTADSIYNTLNTEAEKKIFDKLIQFRLTGDIYTRISNRQIKDYPTLRNTLKLMFTKLVSINELERAMCTTKQSYGETIRNYGYRLMEALEKYKNGYRVKYQLDQIDKTYENHLDSTAVQTFKCGLNNTVLREKIATSRAKDIDTIITETEETEKMLNMTIDTMNLQPNLQIGTLRPTQEPHARNKIEPRQVICNYCNKPNHTWEICRTRLFKERSMNRNTSYQRNTFIPYNQQPPSNPRNNYASVQQPHNNFMPLHPSSPPRNRYAQPQNYNTISPPRQNTQFQPKYCSHCKNTTGHTTEQCRSKFFSPRTNLNTTYNSNNKPREPDISNLTDQFNNMRVNIIAPQPEHIQQLFSNPQLQNQGNEQGSSQQ